MRPKCSNYLLPIVSHLSYFIFILARVIEEKTVMHYSINFFIFFIFIHLDYCSLYASIFRSEKLIDLIEYSLLNLSLRLIYEKRVRFNGRLVLNMMSLYLWSILFLNELIDLAFTVSSGRLFQALQTLFVKKF